MRIDKDKKLKDILKIVGPGTQLREGLENILRAKTGGLIVLGDSEKVVVAAMVHAMILKQQRLVKMKKRKRN